MSAGLAQVMVGLALLIVSFPSAVSVLGVLHGFWLHPIPVTVKFVSPAGIKFEVVIVRVDVLDVGEFPEKVSVLGKKLYVAPDGKDVVRLKVTSRLPFPVLVAVTV